MSEKEIVIAIAVYDTVDNQRTKYTKATYKSLLQTINPDTTNIIFINNQSCKETEDFLNSILENNVFVIHNSKNVGTAEAINQGWKYFEEVPFKIKLDNDIEFSKPGWADMMKRILEEAPHIGILGLKRTDLPNGPDSKDYPTEVDYVGKKKPENMIEYCPDIIGSCIMMNPLLFEKVGYLWQPSIYGFDDNIICWKSIICEFKNAFYSYVPIIHLDEGNTPFTQWKKNMAGLYLPKIEKIINDLKSGTRNIYYNPFNS